MEAQTNKRINLSLITCRILRPYTINPLNNIQHNLASKIMDKMMQKKRGSSNGTLSQ